MRSKREPRPKREKPDEVLVLDVGATRDATLLDPFRMNEWYSYSACLANHPEQNSYTFGLNVAKDSVKAPILFVWRTDYVYPPNILAAYLESLKTAWFAAPYDVFIGSSEVNSAFVRSHMNALDLFDIDFWKERCARLSLYETQDPALFAIHRAVWNRVGGLHHQLWGYGGQFAEFAARVRVACPDSRVDYFKCSPPVHQTHGGSNMTEPAQMKAEAQAGIDRFTAFLGGESAYRIYRLKQNLSPISARRTD